VWNEETQNFLLTLINKLHTVTIKFPRSKRHRNLNTPKGYSSSSWDANQAKFDSPLGGYGPPQSVNGSFYHHHSDSSFQALHPNVDLESHHLPKALRAAYPKLARGRRSDIPQPESPEPIELPSSPPHTPLLPADVPLAEGLEVGNPDKDQAEVDVALAAALSQNTTETSRDGVHAEFLVQKSARPREDTVDDTKISTVEGFDDNDDSGIVLDHSFKSDTEDFVEDAPYADTIDGADASQFADSAYGTQPSQDTYEFLPEMDDSPAGDTHMAGNSHTSSNPSDCSSNSKISQPSEQPRKKLTPKSPATSGRYTRFSTGTSRLSQMELPPSSPDHAPASSLGKHTRKTDDDIDEKVEEPKSKRNKSTRSQVSRA
jgi:hypothetical protein